MRLDKYAAVPPKGQIKPSIIEDATARLAVPTVASAGLLLEEGDEVVAAEVGGGLAGAVDHAGE